MAESQRHMGPSGSPPVGVPGPAAHTVPSTGELERLGVYDPAAPNADDVLRILGRVFELGATVEEVVEAAKIHGLGTLAMELMIRPPGQLVDFAEAAAQAGLDEATAARLWRAVGFADASSPAARLSPDEVGLLRVVAGAIELLGEETALAVTRVAGSAAAGWVRPSPTPSGSSGSSRSWTQGISTPWSSKGTALSPATSCHPFSTPWVPSSAVTCSRPPTGCGLPTRRAVR